ncbi:hypothetical protein Tco_1080563 [Tanacetum coccineum]|uniref:Uncharacterized protein n=1 Tax=Tanacetum coccineum TaxID=301880 RepID=A0ABQ5HWY7_9ASTR
MIIPRLFSAANPDDINMAIHLINERARPWTTLMVVGFNYGANMLTEYLAEVGEDTPHTAATSSDAADIETRFIGFFDGRIQIVGQVRNTSAKVVNASAFCFGTKTGNSRLLYGFLRVPTHNYLQPFSVNIVHEYKSGLEIFERHITKAIDANLGYTFDSKMDA